MAPKPGPRYLFLARTTVHSGHLPPVHTDDRICLQITQTVIDAHARAHKQHARAPTHTDNRVSLCGQIRMAATKAKAGSRHGRGRSGGTYLAGKARGRRAGLPARPFFFGGGGLSLLQLNFVFKLRARSKTAHPSPLREIGPSLTLAEAGRRPGFSLV